MVTTRSRGTGRLDEVALPDLPDPGPEALAAAAGACRRVVLRGGEPTLRPDLPEVVAAVAEVCPPLLRTDGLGLSSQGAVAPLVGAGLVGVRLPLHSGRRDAHDWLVGRPGSTRAVVRAIRACRSAGLRVEVEITVTRPTASHLRETVELALRLGAEGILLRRLRCRGSAALDYVALSARVELLPPLLEEATRVSGGDVTLEGFPRCATGAAEDRCQAQGSSPIATIDSRPWIDLRASLAAPETAARCDSCPGPPACPGLCRGYVHLFGVGALGRDGGMSS